MTETISIYSEKHKERIKSTNYCSTCGVKISYETSASFENGECEDCAEMYYSNQETVTNLFNKSVTKLIRGERQDQYFKY